MTPAPTLQELIDTVRADAASDAPLDQLATAAATVAELAETGDAALGHFVDQCRRRGHSWTEISAALGVTKQAAHKRFSENVANLERFTPRARTVLEAAVTAARDLGHAEVGPEHLLLGMFASPESIAGHILAAAGAGQDAVRRTVAKRRRKDDAVPALPPYPPAAAEVVTGAISEALQLGHNFVGTEHLLLALFRDEESVAAGILRDLGLSHDGVRSEVVRLLSSL